MAGPLYSLDQSGTTTLRRSPTKVGVKWNTLVACFHRQGMHREYKALTGCGLGVRGCFEAPTGWGLAPCSRWYCPACAHRRQKRMSWKWVGGIRRVMGEGGGCAALTLTTSADGSAAARMARLRKSLVQIRGKAAWRKKGQGWSEQVGVLAAFEVSTGEHGQIHPHVHLVLFGPHLATVTACQQWLLATWLDLNPNANSGAQRAGPTLGLAGGWEPQVTYLFKGTVLDPGAAKAVLQGVMALFPSGARQFSSWGCFGRSPGKAPRRLVPSGEGMAKSA